MLSIYRIFYEDFKNDWINKFLTYDTDRIISGCEIHVNLKDIEEKEYISKLIKNNPAKEWIYQFHGPELLEYCNDYQDILNYYDDFSQKLGYKLNVTFHPVSQNTCVEENILRTKKELYTICNLVEKRNMNIDICLENLNKSLGQYRCNLDDIYSCLDMDGVKFTWDIGHQVVDNNCTYMLSERHKDKLGNIHIHDTKEKDHYPFYYNKTDLNRCFDYLLSIKYDGPIVAEIGLSCLNSVTFDERVIEYIKNLHILSQSYNATLLNKINNN